MLKVCAVLYGAILLVGDWEYTTLDGWAGIRQEDGRLDEVPLKSMHFVGAANGNHEVSL